MSNFFAWIYILPSGQGFALKRKQKVKHDYNKLLRKERKREPESKSLYEEEYPEHLRHLYLAEAEKLKSEARANRMNRSKMRMQGQKKGDEMPGNDTLDEKPSEAADPDPDADAGPERTDPVVGSDDPPAAADKERWESRSETSLSHEATSLGWVLKILVT